MNIKKEPIRKELKTFEPNAMNVVERTLKLHGICTNLCTITMWHH